MDDEVRNLPIADKNRLNVMATSALHDFAKAYFIPVILSQLRKDPYEQAVAMTYERMCLWLEALASLPAAKHFQVAFSGARAMFEHLLDIKKLEKKPTLGDAFWDFATVRRYDIAVQKTEYAKGGPRHEYIPDRAGGRQ